MQLTTYIRLFRKWLWLIILSSVLAGGIVFFVTRKQPSMYQASVTLEVGSGAVNPNPDKSSAELAQLLTDSYITKVRFYSVSEATVKALSLPISADNLLKIFDARAAPNTPIFTVTVTYNEPETAAAIANELAHQLILNQSPSSEQQNMIQMLKSAQIDVQKRIDAQKIELADVDKRLTEASGVDQAVLAARRTELTNQINASEANLNGFITQLIKIQQDNNANTVRVIEAARIPTNTVGPTIMNNTLTAGVVGVVLAIGIILALEYFNDSIRTPSEILPLLGLPLIGAIAPFGKRKTNKDKLITRSHPSSPISETYRALRVSLLCTGQDRKAESTCLHYVVTSPNAQEGKSVTAANLAVTYANAGMHVLLIDADLREPAQHKLFGLPNAAGLSTLLAIDTFGKSKAETSEEASIAIHSQEATKKNALGSLAQDSIPMVHPAIIENSSHQSSQKSRIDKMRADLSPVMQATGIAGLDVITSGPVPSNPAELLGSVQMKDLIKQFAEKDKVFDVVIFDTPPWLTVSDSTVLTSLTRGEVLLVVAAGYTSRASAVRVVQQLVALTLPIAGVVVNRSNPRDIDVGYTEQGSGQMTIGLPTRNVAALARPLPATQRNGSAKQRP